MITDKLLNRAISIACVCCYAIIICRHLDIEPKDALDQLLARGRGWLDDRRAINKTLRQIDDLPELRDTGA